MPEYEARITIYRDGDEITFSDATGDTPSWALYAAYNDLENELKDYERERPE